MFTLDLMRIYIQLHAPADYWYTYPMQMNPWMSIREWSNSRVCGYFIRIVTDDVFFIRFKPVTILIKIYRTEESDLNLKVGSL